MAVLSIPASRLELLLITGRAELVGPAGYIPVLENLSSASKNTDSSVFYTEIETKILNTDSDPKKY